MPSQYLSESMLSQLRCPEGRQHVEIFDSLLKGLYVDVQHSGRMRYRVRYQLSGKPKVLTLGDARVLTLDEARDAAREVLRKVHHQIDPKYAEPIPTTMSVEDFFLSQYLPFVKSYKRSWGTDESLIRNHIVPRLGRCSMAFLTQGEIAQAISDMRDKAYSPSTCNRVLVMLRYGFRLALRWRVDGVSRNPAADLIPLAADNRIERYLTPEQSNALFDNLRRSPNALLPYIVAFLLLTGARKREVLDARWGDVDFDQCLWRIPKTKSGRIRHVPLSTEALRLLQQLRSDVPSDSEFLFPNAATGKPFNSIFASWDTARQRTGLPELRIHDLRHSFASFLVNAGRSLYEVQQLLGHADIRTTSRYAHLSRDRLKEAVESIPVKPTRQ